MPELPEVETTRRGIRAALSGRVVTGFELRQHRLRFDPALGFHFYDLDFCRSAEAAGLRLGVWPLAITHQSSGQSVQSPAWERSCRLYLQKHGELALFTGSNG